MTNGIDLIRLQRTWTHYTNRDASSSALILQKNALSAHIGQLTPKPARGRRTKKGALNPDLDGCGAI